MSLRHSYAYTHPVQGALVNLLLLVALVLLGYGLQAPILTLEQFYIFSNTVSLLSAVEQLWQQQEIGLFLLIGGFSVVFPVLKIMMLLIIWNLSSTDGRWHQRFLGWLEEYSKWSMLDVFVVALLIVSVKLGAVLEATVEEGIYAFAASVVLTMVVSTWVGRRARQTNNSSKV